MFINVTLRGMFCFPGFTALSVGTSSKASVFFLFQLLEDANEVFFLWMAVLSLSCSRWNLCCGQLGSRVCGLCSWNMWIL